MGLLPKIFLGLFTVAFIALGIFIGWQIVAGGNTVVDLLWKPH